MGGGGGGWRVGGEQIRDNAREVADYVYFIDRGEVVEHATAQAFFDSPRDARTRDFLDKVL